MIGETEGVRLKELLSQRSFGVDEIVELGVQIADALEAAHAKGILHGELEPAKVLVTRRGQVEVLGFGPSRLPTEPGRTGGQDMTGPLVASDADLTHDSAAPAGFAYMSPERLRGEPVDARSDVYSLGAILYEMATGRAAFTGTAAAVFDGIVNRAPVSARQLRPDLPAELVRIVAKSIEKDRGRRYQSAAEIRPDLLRLRRDDKMSRPGASRLRRAWQAAAAVAVAAALGGLGWWRLGLREPGRIRSLAVLPLQNVSGDPEEEYFADGMTEALIADLAKIRALRVISRTSVMRYKDARKPLPEIARELGVDALVEGSVLRAGSRVRITTQLVDGASDRHLWSETYERDLSDVLALQREVARAIVGEVRVVLSPREHEGLAPARQVDPEAHRLYLKGRYQWNKRTPEGFERARGLFEQALEADPSYAQAWAGLADTYAILTGLGFDLQPPREVMPKAKAAAHKALEIDERLAEAHASLAWVQLNFDWDFASAESGFRRAIDLEPGYGTAHHWYSRLLLVTGRREEALAEARRALELDPLSVVVESNLSYLLHCLRRFDEAEARCRRTLELQPDFPMAHLILASSRVGQGRYDDAIAQLTRSPAFARIPLALSLLGNAYGLSGRRREAREVLDQLGALGRQRYVPAYEVALVHAGLGDADAAFAWLERAYEERSEALLYLTLGPQLDAIRSDPRLAHLTRKVGLAGG